MKVIASIRKDARQMLLALDEVVKKKTKDAPLDMFIEKDRFGRTKFILQERVKDEDKLEIKAERDESGQIRFVVEEKTEVTEENELLDKKVLEYLQANPKEKKKLLQEISKRKVKEIKESMQTELIEAVQGFREARFEDNTIKNVTLINKISRNNRVYTDKALNDIVDLADSVKVFADHKLENRSVRDLVGRISNPHKTDGTIRGDLEVLENHKDWIFAIAKQMPEIAGMSIRAMGSINPERDGKGREVVENVIVLKSIDLVSDPATTKSLFENQ